MSNQHDALKVIKHDKKVINTVSCGGYLASLNVGYAVEEHQGAVSKYGSPIDRKF